METEIVWYVSKGRGLEFGAIVARCGTETQARELAITAGYQLMKRVEGIRADGTTFISPLTNAR